MCGRSAGWLSTRLTRARVSVAAWWRPQFRSAAAVQECGRLGARKVTLRVLGHNVAARRLYDRCGFVPEGVLRGEFLLEGRYVDNVLMACHLAVDVP